MGKFFLIAALILAALSFAACAPGANQLVGTAPAGGPENAKLAGFWQGLWHGMIAPVTFIISLFKDSVSIYEVHNSGNWYDVGFILGLSVSLGGSGGGAAAARRRRRDD